MTSAHRRITKHAGNASQPSSFKSGEIFPVKLFWTVQNSNRIQIFRTPADPSEPGGATGNQTVNSGRSEDGFSRVIAYGQICQTLNSRERRESTVLRHSRTLLLMLSHSKWRSIGTNGTFQKRQFCALNREDAL
jgi:hypothetical protein